MDDGTELVLRLVTNYLQEQKETTSHLGLCRALRPHHVYTQTSYLSMTTLDHCQTLGGFEKLNIEQIAMQNQDLALLRWRHRYWWVGPLLFLATSWFILPLMSVVAVAVTIVATIVLMALVIRDLCDFLLLRWQTTCLLLPGIWLTGPLLHTLLDNVIARYMFTFLNGVVSCVITLYLLRHVAQRWSAVSRLMAVVVFMFFYPCVSIWPAIWIMVRLGIKFI